MYIYYYNRFCLKYIIEKNIVIAYISHKYMCTELVKISRSIYSTHMEIVNPLSILDIIILLRLYMGKVDNIGRN